MRETIPTDLPVPRGIVTVQLSDADTGRVTFQETGENFISLQSKEVARWFQRFMWGMFLPVETKNAAGYRPTEMPWFPADHIAYWNDATAESASTERVVRTELVGWASRHPVGSPSGKRGVVNISESELTDTAAKWVFDWVTSQGNGTFQSVGFTRVDEATGLPMARWPHDDLVTITHTGTVASVWSALAYSSSKWYALDAVTSGSASRVVSVATTGGTSSVEATLSGWGIAANAGIARDLEVSGTDYYVCGYKNSPANPRLTKNSSSGATTWTRDETGITGQYYGLTVDGSGKLWTAGSDGIMRRCSATDGTIEVSVTPACAPTALYGIAYDPADGHFWIAGSFASGHYGVVKVDNSGGTIGPMFGLNPTAYTTASTAGSPEPASGSYYVPASAGRDTFTFERNISSGSTSSAFAVNRTPSVGNALGNAGGYGIGLAIGAGGQLYMGTSTGSGTSKVASLHGDTLGSRLKLSSPLTKTNTQNLKITYQFDFV